MSIFNFLRGRAPRTARAEAALPVPPAQADELPGVLEISDGDLEEAVGGLERIYAFDLMEGALEKRA